MSRAKTNSSKENTLDVQVMLRLSSVDLGIIIKHLRWENYTRPASKIVQTAIKVLVEGIKDQNAEVGNILFDDPEYFKKLFKEVTSTKQVEIGKDNIIPIPSNSFKTDKMHDPFADAGEQSFEEWQREQIKKQTESAKETKDNEKQTSSS